MKQRPPIELSVTKFCMSCGKSNVVMLANLGCDPICRHCGKRLPVTGGELISAGNMYIFALAAGETIKIV